MIERPSSMQKNLGRNATRRTLKMTKMIGSKRRLTTRRILGQINLWTDC
jgi:hypothetical protein